MNYFFTHAYSNEERWNFIEDFFLGENNEELIRRYPGREIKRVDDRNYYFTTCVNPRSKLSYMSKKRFAAEIGKTIELLD